MTKDDLRVRSKRLARYGFTNYAAYVKSSRWQTTRRRWHKAKGYPPCVCGDPAVLLHHKTYQRLGEEALDDLVAMCDDCHSTVHRLADAGLMSLDPAEWVDAGRAKENRKRRAEEELRAEEEFKAEWKVSPLDVDARMRRAALREARRQKVRVARMKQHKAAKKPAKRNAA